MAKIGDNSESYRVTAEELKGFIARIEGLDAQRTDLAEDIKEVKAEAKARGYDMKALAAVIRRRKQDRDAVKELDAVIDLYEDTLGIFS
jgi:uncharacterized protein (UPF0335 family)